jgi:hypothetical protein
VEFYDKKLLEFDLPTKDEYSGEARAFVEMHWNWARFAIGFDFTNDSSLGSYSINNSKMENGKFVGEPIYTVARYPRDLVLFVGPIVIGIRWSKIIVTKQEKEEENEI